MKALLQHDKIDTSMEYIHDAEDVIQQRISPLRLVLERLSGGAAFEPLQLMMGGEVVEGETSAAVMPVEGGIVEVVDLVDDMFPEIKDGVEVRSVFKTDDLRLIRGAFIGYVRSGYAGPDELKLRFLLKRMLRKVKG
ncbi:hypothetical protein ES708_33999 [subsurface metagenome]